MKENHTVHVDSTKYPWLHIYAQPQWHSDVRIMGTREALIGLRDAISFCLNLRSEETEAKGMTSDGEGYRVKISICSMKHLARLPLPYTEPFAGGVWRPMD